MLLEEWSGLAVPQLWFRDTRALTFSEFVEETSGWFDLPKPILDELDQQQPTEPFEEARAALYRDCRCRIGLGQPFAVCFVAIDHLEACRHHYGRKSADRVLAVVSRILRDVVGGMCPSEGVVTHVGEGEFILVLPASQGQEAIAEVISVFDTLVPLQYDDRDRRAGYIMEKGARIPIMTVSVGIETNEHRTFKHFTQIAELATEMLGYARTLPGSVLVFDRRQDGQ